MNTLTSLELMFLCRLVDDDLSRMKKRIERCDRYILRGEDRYKEKAIAEAEYDSLLVVKKKINNELALRELYPDFLNNIRK